MEEEYIWKNNKKEMKTKKGNSLKIRKGEKNFNYKTKLIWYDQ